MGQSCIGCHGSLSFGLQWAMLESVLAIPGYILSINPGPNELFSPRLLLAARLAWRRQGQHLLHACLWF